MTDTFTTTFPTTPNPTWTLPRFTPPPECLDTKSVWKLDTDCYSGTAQGLYRTTRTCDYLWLGYTDYPHTTGGLGHGLNGFCGPGWSHPATECPVGYTPAHTVDYTPDATTSREILCCLAGSSATPYDRFCVASNLTPSGTSPLTLTAFDLSSINSGGTTCVPDCADPYTGGPWPRPEQTVTPAPPSPNDSGLVGLEKLAWVGIGFGIVAGLGIIACIGCCIHRRRKRKRIVAAEGPAANPGVEEGQNQMSVELQVSKGQKSE
ncbi:hypothetical protein CEK26_009120 [Fusarium fujikuroi]|nr:hypothetical protein CEK27_009139 [Fusarium fujikuroi]QGI96051.1 hypothetical protein CEK26_009120 [Fusarium fujikuroi]